MAKPSLPQGTRDFGPETVRKRNFIIHTIQSVFQLYGFQPLETPAFENLETLMGKYGDEGDKLIFKILNNGLDKAEKEKQAREDFEKVLAGKNVKGFTERALKYDLTIPFARYVALNHQQLSFPFKRYQVQPVWRADKPQRGRYREFYQCDADVVGSTSLLNELEFIHIYHEVFTRLGMPDYTLAINHRKILSALATITGGTEQLTPITVAIDKLDKIGLEKVKAELLQKGLTPNQVSVIEQFLLVTGTNEEILNGLSTLIGETATGKKGLEDLHYLISHCRDKSIHLSVDPTLARGLNYYTGTIFEAKAPPAVKMGSIGGGGRYDDLTGLFGVDGIPGVGISFGLDRIYDVMEELGLFPPDLQISSRVLFFNLGPKESEQSFQLLQQLRQKGVSAELYHEATKFDKQFKYAERKNIPFVIIIGEKELQDQTCTIKNLGSGTQQTIPASELINHTF